MALCCLCVEHSLAVVTWGKSGLLGYFHVFEFDGTLAAGVRFTTLEMTGHGLGVAMYRLDTQVARAEKLFSCLLILSHVRRWFMQGCFYGQVDNGQQPLDNWR